jgi:hypothetical protein
MDNDLREVKENKLLRLKKEVELIEREIELLSLIDQTEQELIPNSIEDKFPIGTAVTFSNPKESPNLKGKRAEVIGHSPKFVRVKRRKKSLLRHPNNLTPQK